MSDEQVYVQHPDTPDAAPGKVPARALAHWQAKGFVQVDKDGKTVTAAEATTTDPVAAAPVDTDGTAAASADIQPSQPKTGRAGRTG